MPFTKLPAKAGNGILMGPRLREFERRDTEPQQCSRGGNFTVPPEITFAGGNIDPNTGLPDPDFKPAKAEAIINSKGELSRIKVLDSGSFYHSTPTIMLMETHLSTDNWQ